MRHDSAYVVTGMVIRYGVDGSGGTATFNTGRGGVVPVQSLAIVNGAGPRRDPVQALHDVKELFADPLVRRQAGQDVVFNGGSIGNAQRLEERMRNQYVEGAEGERPAKASVPANQGNSAPASSPSPQKDMGNRRGGVAPVETEPTVEPVRRFQPAPSPG